MSCKYWYACHNGIVSFVTPLLTCHVNKFHFTVMQQSFSVLLKICCFFFWAFPFPRRESHWHGQYKDNTSVCLCSNLILFLYLSLQYTTRITLTCSNAIFFLLLGYLICEPLFNKGNFFLRLGCIVLRTWPNVDISGPNGRCH